MPNDISFAVQIALRARLIGTPAVTALVPADNIRDRHERPIIDPCILIGEDQVIDTGMTLKRDWVRVISTLHIWKKELDFEGAKAIANAIRRAIGRVRRLDLNDADYVCADCKISGTTFIREPGGELSHGVVKIESLIQQRWSVTI